MKTLTIIVALIASVALAGDWPYITEGNKARPMTIVEACSTWPQFYSATNGVLYKTTIIKTDVIETNLDAVVYWTVADIVYRIGFTLPVDPLKVNQALDAKIDAAPDLASLKAAIKDKANATAGFNQLGADRDWSVPPPMVVTNQVTVTNSIAVQP